jgi:hypothetical protein
MNNLLNNVIEHILKPVIVLPFFNFLKMMMIHLKLLIDDDKSENDDELNSYSQLNAFEMTTEPSFLRLTLEIYSV